MTLPVTEPAPSSPSEAQANPDHEDDASSEEAVNPEIQEIGRAVGMSEAPGGENLMVATSEIPGPGGETSGVKLQGGQARWIEAVRPSQKAVLRPTTHARGDGVLPTWADLALAAAMAREQERLQAKAAARLSRRRIVCGAKTRKGTACRNLSEAGRARCKFHGEKSTGPRTAEGSARIAEAQKRRWAAWRVGRGRA